MFGSFLIVVGLDNPGQRRLFPGVFLGGMFWDDGGHCDWVFSYP